MLQYTRFEEIDKKKTNILYRDNEWENQEDIGQKEEREMQSVLRSREERWRHKEERICHKNSGAQSQYNTAKQNWNSLPNPKTEQIKVNERKQIEKKVRQQRNKRERGSKRI